MQINHYYEGYVYEIHPALASSQYIKAVRWAQRREAVKDWTLPKWQWFEENILPFVCFILLFVLFALLQFIR